MAKTGDLAVDARDEKMAGKVLEEVSEPSKPRGRKRPGRS